MEGNLYSRRHLSRLINRNRIQIQNEINVDDNDELIDRNENVQMEINNELIEADDSDIGDASGVSDDSDIGNAGGVSDDSDIGNDGGASDDSDIGNAGGASDDSDIGNANGVSDDSDIGNGGGVSDDSDIGNAGGASDESDIGGVADDFNGSNDFEDSDTGDSDDFVDFDDEDFDLDDDMAEVNDAEDGDVGRVTIKEQLATWTRTHNVSCIATAELLTLLRENGHPELPQCRATLLGTPKTPITLRTCAPGKYYHFGLKKCLRKCNFSFLQHIDIIEIDINIDGVSLSKSSTLKLWPIQAAFSRYPNTSPLLIGCYEGYANPNDIGVYLQEFVEEMKDILINGCEVTPERIHKRLKIRLFCCDMPARSFVKNVFGHTSLYGCDRCNQRCDHIGATMTYQTFKGDERTDETFNNRTHHVMHHKDWSLQNPMPIEELQLGMVTQFCIDDMHAVYLGVARKMLLCIFKGRCASVFLDDEFKEILDSRYISYAPFIPSEFIRKTRSVLKQGSKFKAVEFRLFLLYTGIVLLRDSVGPALYQHFLLLSASIRFLSSSLTCEVNDNIIEQMLNKFVTDYALIYDPKHVVYCVHSLLHLQEDVRRYGPIGTYSAFRFENHQREIKKHVKSQTKILQQIHNRIEEIEEINEVNIPIGYIGRPIRRQIDQDIFPGCNSSYRGFQYGSFILETNIKDNCCVLNSNIPIEVQGFINYEGQDFILAKKFTNPRNYFTEPFESADYMGVLLVDPPSAEVFFFKNEEVKYKFMRLPHNLSFVLIPILHHLD